MKSFSVLDISFISVYHSLPNILTFLLAQYKEYTLFYPTGQVDPMDENDGFLIQEQGIDLFASRCTVFYNQSPTELLNNL